MSKYLYIVFQDFNDFIEFEKVISKIRYIDENNQIRQVDDYVSYSAISPENDYLIQKSSRKLSIITFFSGLLGILLAIWFQFWTSAIDYPLNLSGKPFFSFLVSIPITFEFMILISSFVLLVSFLFFSKSKIKGEDMGEEIKELISEGKVVIKIKTVLMKNEFFGRNVRDLIEDEKIIIHKSND